MKLLISGDLHLRHTKPRCRTDASFFDMQKLTLQAMNMIAEREQVFGIVLLGDVFDQGAVSQQIEQLFLDIASAQSSVPWYIMPGNHDLPQHSWKNVFNSSFGVIWTHAHCNFSARQGIQPLDELMDWEHFQEPREIVKASKQDTKHILAVHRLVCPEDMTIPNTKLVHPSELFSLVHAPEKTIILAGDYHAGHEWRSQRTEGKLVIVPGCTIRMKADEKDYKPSVVILDTDNLTYKRELLPDAQPAFYDLVVDDYLTEKETREDIHDAQFDEVIELAKGLSVDSIDYIQNVRTALESGKHSQQMVAEVLAAIEE